MDPNGHGSAAPFGGSRCSHLLSLMDLYATFEELFGGDLTSDHGQPQSGLDSISFLARLSARSGRDGPDESVLDCAAMPPARNHLLSVASSWDVDPAVRRAPLAPSLTI